MSRKGKDRKRWQGKVIVVMDGIKLLVTCIPLLIGIIVYPCTAFVLMYIFNRCIVEVHVQESFMLRHVVTCDLGPVIPISYVCKSIQKQPITRFLFYDRSRGKKPHFHTIEISLVCVGAIV